MAFSKPASRLKPISRETQQALLRLRCWVRYRAVLRAPALVALFRRGVPCEHGPESRRQYDEQTTIASDGAGGGVIVADPVLSAPADWVPGDERATSSLKGGR